MQKNSEAQNKVVQTYADDIAKIIQDDRGGLIKKIIHEEEGYEIANRNKSPESKKNLFFMIVGSMFLLISLVTLLFFFLNKEKDTVEIEKQFVPIIFNDRNTFLEVSGLKKEAISQTILNAVNTTSVKDGGVDGIYLTENKKIIGMRRFVDLIKANFSPGDNAIFVGDNFMLGVVNTTTKDFFMILKMRSAADIFDSLRAWESKMFFDLHGFFGVDITSKTKHLLTDEFQDGIVENKNARILYTKDEDQTNKIVMMYILADDDSIVITNTENAAHEVMLRLAASKVKK